MSMEPGVSVKLTDYRVKREGGGLPRFFGEILGGDTHGSNLEEISESLAKSSTSMQETLGKKASEQTDLLKHQTGFSTDFALKRDYRSRYGTSEWHRQKGMVSSRRTSFMKGVFKKYTEKV